MKRAIIASILGIATSVATTYGQGYISMTSYLYVNSSLQYYSGIKATGGALDGQYLGSTFQVQLWYETGTMTSFALATGNSLVHLYPASHNGGTPTTDGAGIFVAGAGNSGAAAVLPNYTSGACNFLLQCYDGASYGAGTYYGTSAPFTISGIQTDSTAPPTGDLLNVVGGVITGLQSFSVVPTPEPSTFTLAGLGAAAMLIFRRRK